ncbi:aldose 1-epimerase [Streptacidiphilus jiangxiensis]|uniref:Aldose 1-epimerase n=1 Tax=Streptacidiphilus jiangxiensis TaxID=235985 RepID=A0A1H7JT42_STRJI|nr:aldose 1-epimerase [Streptacidiphilus jiangxiensis]SEK77828.1 aldose 1-epimerase [Streptacidiphilus jiangxiensis]
MLHPAPVLLTAGDVAVSVLPDAGCRLGSLRIGAHELLRTAQEIDDPAADVFGYGSFPMVPWAGRVDRGLFNNGPVRHRLPVDLTPHAAHGTAVRSRWRTAAAPAVTDEGTTAAFVLELADPWPYPGRVTQLFELTPERLRTTLSVEALRDSFPAQAGWHPWFRKWLRDGGPQASLDFAPAWQEERGADHLPTGRRIDPQPGPWDDCFAFPDGVDVTVRWGEELALRVTSDCAWAVVFDEQADALCVEPQSGPPNGLNSAPHLVTPIEPLEVSTTWTWRRGSARHSG